METPLDHRDIVPTDLARALHCITGIGRPFLESAAMSSTSSDDGELVELGEWPRLAAQILRHRLDTAGIPVMVEWSDNDANTTGTLVVPGEHADFAWAVVNEIDVDDEVPDTSPYAYVSRIEEHLSAAAELLEELRTSLDDLENTNRE
jgi:hypothetical protein